MFCANLCHFECFDKLQFWISRKTGVLAQKVRLAIENKKNNNRHISKTVVTVPDLPKIRLIIFGVYHEYILSKYVK